MKIYEIEVNGHGKHIKASGFEFTEYGRCEFYRDEEDTLQKHKTPIASYPADSIHIINAKDEEEDE